MGLLPYAARDVLRNRRRTVSSILGVLLAVTFVAGTFIAIDSSARATLDVTLQGIPGDFSLYVNVFEPSTFNYTTLQEALVDVAGVIDSSLYRSIQVSQFEAPGRPLPPYSTYTTTYAIDPDHRPSFLRDAAYTGSLDLPRGTVGITKDLANQLSVGIGNPVVAVYQWNETIRYERSLTVTALLDTPTYGYYVSPVPIYPFGSLAVVHLRDADWLMDQLNQSQSYGYTVVGEVWIDRAHYVNPYDLDTTTRNLERIQRRLQGIAGPGSPVQDNILVRIQDFQDRITTLRVQYLLFSMPVVLLGVYLGAVGVDLSHAERRRELAVLKTRGARRSQLVGLLILEAVVGGVAAAVVGLAVGVGLSRLLLGVVNPYYGTAPQYEPFILSFDTVAIVALLAIALMGLVAYRSAKRTASLPVVETLRYYAPGETKIQYSPRTDIVLVSVGVLDYVLVWWRGGATSSIWTFLLGILPFLLLPFVPIMLVVGLTRLLTRSTAKVYDLFARAAKPLTKDLYYVIRRNLARNPRRSSSVAIIIALGLAFGVFSLSVLATNDAHTEREIRAQVGADMAVSPIDTKTDLTTNLTGIPGVAGVSKISTLSYLTVAYGYATVYALDPDAYFAVAQPESWYFPDGNPATAHDVLATPGQALVSQSFYDQAYLEIGDRIPLYATLYDSNGTFLGTIQMNVTVGGVVRYFPGMGYSYYYQTSIFASYATLAPVLNPQQGSVPAFPVAYLVDLSPSADWRAVEASILEDSNVGYIQSTQEQIEALSTNPFARAFYGFVAMEIVFIVVILTAGVGLILFAASLERDVEFAAIIARGSSGWQTAKLLVGEAFVIMLVGLAIGLIVGLGTAFFATQFIAAGPPGTPPPAVPYFFVFPRDAVLLVLLGPGAMLLSAVLVSARTAHMNVAKVLKLRGG